MAYNSYVVSKHKFINKIVNDDCEKDVKVFLLGMQYVHIDNAYVYRKIINKQERDRLINHCTKMFRKVRYSK